MIVEHIPWNLVDIFSRAIISITILAFIGNKIILPDIILVFIGLVLALWVNEPILKDKEESK